MPIRSWMPCNATCPSRAPKTRRRCATTRSKFAECMREHGVDMPDPTFDGVGGAAVIIQGSNSDSAPLDTDKFNEASSACNAEGAGGGSACRPWRSGRRVSVGSACAREQVMRRRRFLGSIGALAVVGSVATVVALGGRGDDSEPRLPTGGRRRRPPSPPSRSRRVTSCRPPTSTARSATATRSDLVGRRRRHGHRDRPRRHDRRPRR